MEVTLPIAGLAAAFPMAAKKDVRYYLNGVLVEVSDTHVHFVGTDGHTMACAKCEYAENSPVAPFILKGEDVAFILKNITDADALKVTFGEAPNLEIKFGSHTIKTSAIDGKFPDWRKVSAIESGQRGRNVCVNPKFLARVDKSVAGAKKFGGFVRYTGVFLESNGHDRPLAMLARGEEMQIAFLLMPIRDEYAEALNHTDAGILAPVFKEAA